MADQRRVRRIRLALIEQGLQPPGWPLKEERFDSIGHISFYHSIQPSAFSNQPKQINRKERDGHKGFMRGNVVRAFALFASFAVRFLLTAEC
jgi:hypothetical protein